MYKLLNTYEFTCDKCKDKLVVHQTDARLPRGWKYLIPDESLLIGYVYIQPSEICPKCDKIV